MSVRQISPGEERYVEKLLSELAGGDTDDSPEWMSWVLKKKRSKIQDRLIVVSKYRIVSIKRNKMGKKSTQRQGHLYSLTKVTVDNEFSKCILQFTDFKIEVACPNVREMVDALRSSYQKITYDWPESSCFTISAPDGCLPDVSDSGVSTEEGLMASYEAYCNYYQMKTSPDFRRHIEDTMKGGRSELDLSRCPGIEPKTDYTFDLQPALAAITHISHFRSFKLQNVLRREAVGVFSIPLSKNTTITRVVLSGLDAGPEGFIALGDAFKRNPGNQVCELDLSNNKMGEKGIVGLASGLMTIQHGLLSFNLANNVIPAKGISSLIASLRSNEQVTGTIQDLNLAGNKFDVASSQSFADWITDIKESAISNLNLCDTSCDINTVLTGIRLGLVNTLTQLDLSHNKVERTGAQSISLLIEKTTCLTNINLSYCKIASDGIDALLSAFKGNEAISNLKFGFAGNDLGPSGGSRFANGIAGLDVFHTLNLKDNGLKVEGLVKVLGVLSNNRSLRCLDIGLNVPSASSNIKQLNDALSDFIQKHPALETLMIIGDCAKRTYGPALVKVVESMSQSSSLTEIDLNGNKFGDKAAITICDALRKNETLLYMNWDNNGIAMGGYQALRSCLENSNKTLCYVPHPRGDSERATAGSKDASRSRQRLNELFLEINTLLKKNKEENGRGDVESNIPSRQLSEYKEPPMAPPPPREVKTLRKGGARSLSSSYRTTGSGSVSRASTMSSSQRRPTQQKQPAVQKTPPPPPPEYDEDSEEGSPRRNYTAPPPLGLPPSLDISVSRGRGRGGPSHPPPPGTRPPVFNAPPSLGRQSNAGGNPPPPVFAAPSGRGRGAPPPPPTRLKPPPTPPPKTPLPPPNPPPPLDADDSNGYDEDYDEEYYEDDDSSVPPPPPRDDYDEDDVYGYG